MAKPKRNLLIEKDKHSSSSFKIWTPTPAQAKESIEAIEGIVRVFHSTEYGHLNVWVNLCYDKDELKAEIEAALSDA